MHSHYIHTVLYILFFRLYHCLFKMHLRHSVALLFVSLMWNLCCSHFFISPVVFLPCQIKECFPLFNIYFSILFLNGFISSSSINHIPHVFSNYPAVVYLKNRHDSLCKNIIVQRDEMNQDRCITPVKAEAAGSI